jgi:hypothetical protein
MLAVVLSIPWSNAHSSCNLVPASARTFQSTLGEVSTPFGQIGQRVTIRRTDAVFGKVPSRNTVRLTFHPPGGPETVIDGIVPVAPGSGTGCSPAECVGALCRCLTFTFPDTDDRVGAPNDDLTLAGPLEIVVLTDDAVTAQIDHLFLAGTRIRDDVFPSFVALPPANPFVSFTQGPGPSLMTASDGQGNMLIPFNFAALVPMGALQTRFIDVRAPGLAALPQKDLDAFTPDGRKLPPLLRTLGDDGILASIDAPASVIRIGGALPVAGLAPVEGKGPILVPGVTGVADPRRRADASSLITVGSVAIYESRECGINDPPSECLDLNGDGDQFDYFVYALRLDDPNATPILVDTVDIRSFPGFATHLEEPLYRFVGSEHLVAFEIPEGSVSDLDSNGKKSDIVRAGAFDLDRHVAIPQASDSNRLDLSGSLLAFTVTEDEAQAKDALYVYDASAPAPAAIAVHDSLNPRYFVTRPKPPFDTSLTTLSTGNVLRMAVSGPRVAFIVDEAVQGIDLNADGAVDDALMLFDIRSGVPEKLFRTTAIPQVVLSDRRLVFTDAANAVQRIDLDGSHQVTTEMCNPGLALPAISDELVPCLRFEFGNDLNLDGDTTDAVLAFALPDVSPYTFITPLSLVDLAVNVATVPVVRGALLAVGIDELAQNQDLDGDGMLGGPSPFPFLDVDPSVLFLVNGNRLAQIDASTDFSRILLNTRLKLAFSAPPLIQFIDGGLSIITAEQQRTILRDLDGDGSFEEALEDYLYGGVALDDNCPTVSNPDQLDTNGDGFGDACQPPRECGNGILDEGEACDGPTDGSCPGRCRPDCTCVALCGNGLVDEGEACDGPADGSCPGGCRPDCTCGAFCGNGIAEVKEACDGADDAACPGRCTGSCTCAPAACGNGLLESGESCDGAATGTCRNGCTPTCECACEPASKSTLVLAGKRSLAVHGKAVLPIAAYGGEPVGVSLLAGDRNLATQALGSLTPKGAKQRAFRYVGGKGTPGVRALTLKSARGGAKITLNVQRWLDASTGKAATALRIDVGARCFDATLHAGKR